MKRVLTAVALIPVVLLIVFKAPLWLFALVVAAIALLAMHEYLNLAKGTGIKPVAARCYVLLTVWVADIAAYYVGSSVAKHKLAPVVSPNKSWERPIACVLASIGVG